MEKYWSSEILGGRQTDDIHKIINYNYQTIRRDSVDFVSYRLEIMCIFCGYEDLSNSMTYVPT